ncbi:MAG: type II secretion system F family protein, partial [Armatimonadetes bacterium]|nr:type II secretion system F family protein [Armatimonadota bacterium]
MGKSISRYDVALFTRQLATLVNSGLPIHRSMEVLMRQYIHAPLGLPLSQVQRALGTGHRLAAALAREADVFDSMYVSIVAAGEAQGNLDRTLMELASYLEKETALRERVRSALTYPGFVLAITLLLTWWIFTFVLPQFQPMFQALPGGAPFPTRVLMLIIAVCTRPWAMAIVLGGTAAGLFLALRFLRQPRGRGMWDRASIHLPVFGKLNRKVVMTRITRSLATMMGSGLPIMDVLLQTARTCGNVVYQENLMKAREHLKTGGSLAKFFAQHRDIYPL